ncbi:3-deoxy-manno-octulosonate cytidylyltransferase [Campylobacter insulaenigrae]|uniref:3-deoxy-D-manno-octulosonate cytidylyltransferase n=1 Tax=Campylobacter insulaenigrae NCTC 12927 TaxID=1031564 RepID=A0A0A8H4I9_9BACT|nr:3-deoxy-manno-octulosonate cytidylyltransferase [Campylobacter insulaenigrae]AJC87834.1 3-deoxy-D-manno-octulosonate cytidylyltransferase [Campylobacter insulaenigrae NCTC 12927]MCR6574887.1 3-deoxy-manno-octulosonate cytidylyltransferase [Campylobacter insulaenigrae]MCR6576421.1 3-deoxy-manno-octulosonate cytidylyltransferase [Campylobacter insulaenigrae]MCR6577887.1 3-deoxy-manno-octulosonate cytidylyltransferase [Campylobacter insulaenigrae]MCR6582859.1 3-deoxy-manno-octulosonate cytidyl
MIIIPARLKSSRFENKILCDIDGLPMFVYTAKKMQTIDKVYVAVDDKNVLNIAQKHNIDAVLTNINHESGTDRINETCEILNINQEEIIINVQADEPFIELENIKKFKEFSKCAFENNQTFMTSCYKEIDEFASQDPNLVKVITDINDFALYFSRSKIPYERATYKEKFKAHLGIYAYKVKNLREFCTFKNSTLEECEKLEQLRALENGKKIKMLKITSKSIGIDTKEDYDKAIKILKEQK